MYYLLVLMCFVGDDWVNFFDFVLVEICDSVYLVSYFVGVSYRLKLEIWNDFRMRYNGLIM